MDIRLSSHLEKAFFLTENKNLIEKLQDIKDINEAKENLSKISGIKDDNVLLKLVDLKIRPETFISLCLVPLIEVAWADDMVTDEEKKVILRAAQEMGIRQGNVDYTLVEQWITHKPPPDLLSAWIEYIQQLCSQVSPEVKRIIKADLLEHATAVANASGGILDLGIGNKIAKTQAEMLKKLEAAFGD